MIQEENLPKKELEIISFAASPHCPASFLTSFATTANPRPCLPTRAALMAAFKARRLVWSAMLVIRHHDFPGVLPPAR